MAVNRIDLGPIRRFGCGVRWGVAHLWAGLNGTTGRAARWLDYWTVLIVWWFIL